MDEDAKRREEGFALCTFQAAVADLVIGEGEGVVGMGMGTVVEEGEEEEEGVYEDAVDAVAEEGEEEA